MFAVWMGSEERQKRIQWM